MDGGGVEARSGAKNPDGGAVSSAGVEGAAPPTTAPPAAASTNGGVPGNSSGSLSSSMGGSGSTVSGESGGLVLVGRARGDSTGRVSDVPASRRNTAEPLGGATNAAVSVPPGFFTRRVYDVENGDLEVFELLGSPVWALDVEGWKVVFANRAALQLFEVDTVADIGMGDAGGAVHLECKELLQSIADGTLTELRPRRSLVRAKGKLVPTAATPSAVQLRVSAAEKPQLHLLWTCHRETRRRDRKRGLDALSFTNSRYYTYDPDGSLVWTNTTQPGSQGAPEEVRWALSSSVADSLASASTVSFETRSPMSRPSRKNSSSIGGAGAPGVAVLRSRSQGGDEAGNADKDGEQSVPTSNGSSVLAHSRSGSVSRKPDDASDSRASGASAAGAAANTEESPTASTWSRHARAGSAHGSASSRAARSGPGHRHGSRRATAVAGHSEFALSSAGAVQTTAAAEEEGNLDAADIESRVAQGARSGSPPTSSASAAPASISPMSRMASNRSPAYAYSAPGDLDVRTGAHQKLLDAVTKEDVPVGSELESVQLQDPHNPGAWYRRRVVKVMDAVTGRPAMLVQEEDVTELITAQRELEEALALVNARSEFVAELSHEIRTPLSGVMGMLDCLRSSSLGAAQKDFVDTAIFSSTALLRTLDDALDARKAELGKLQVFERREQLRNLCELAEEVGVLMSQQAYSKGVTVSIDYPVEHYLSGFACITDIHRLRQVLINFASNSIKYTSSGSVSLRLRVTDTGDDVDDGDTGVTVVDETSGAPVGWHRADVDIDRVTDSRVKWVHLEVSDTGEGFDQADSAEMFRRFHRASKDRAAALTSSGLGLAITAHLALLLCARIRVRSERGVGSKFSFSFPSPLFRDGEVVTAGVASAPGASMDRGASSGIPAALDAVDKGSADDDDYLRLAPSLSLKGHRMLVVNSRGFGPSLLRFLEATGLNITLVETVEHAAALLRVPGALKASYSFVVVCDDGPEARSDSAQAAWLEYMEQACNALQAAHRVGREARADSHGDGSPRELKLPERGAVDSSVQSSIGHSLAPSASRSKGPERFTFDEADVEGEDSTATDGAQTGTRATTGKTSVGKSSTMPIARDESLDGSSHSSGSGEAVGLAAALVDDVSDESRRSLQRPTGDTTDDGSKRTLGASDGRSMMSGSLGSRSIAPTSGRVQMNDLRVADRILLKLNCCLPSKARNRLDRRVRSQGRDFEGGSNPALLGTRNSTRRTPSRALDERAYETDTPKASQTRAPGRVVQVQPKKGADESQESPLSPAKLTSRQPSLLEKRGKVSTLKIQSGVAGDAEVLSTSPGRSPKVYAPTQRLFSFTPDGRASSPSISSPGRTLDLGSEAPAIRSVVASGRGHGKFRARAGNGARLSPRLGTPMSVRKNLHISIVAPLHHIFDLPTEASWFDSWVASPLRPSKFIAVLSRTCTHWDRRRRQHRSLPASAQSKPHVSAKAAYTPRSAPQRRVVLICDDNAILRRVASKMLLSLGAGIAVATARNGAEAVEMVSEAPDRFGLVLIDLEMPVLSGVGAVRAIRRKEKADGRQRTPVVALSGHAISGLPAEYRDAGFDDFMRKPVLRGDMKRCVDRWVGPQTAGTPRTGVV